MQPLPQVLDPVSRRHLKDVGGERTSARRMPVRIEPAVVIAGDVHVDGVLDQIGLQHACRVHDDEAEVGRRPPATRSG